MLCSSVEWFWTKHVHHWLKLKQMSVADEKDAFSPTSAVPTWALNLQTVSWDRYHSHEKICTTPSGNERKQKDLRIICFSIIMMLLKSMHLRHAADGSWVRNTMWNFLCVIMVQTHLKAALSNLCMQEIYILQRMVHYDNSGMLFPLTVNV